MQSYILLDEGQETVQSVSKALTLGRRAGILLLLQLIAALTLPFILSKPITVGSPAFLTAVTEHSLQIRSAVLLSLVGSALTVWLGITAHQAFRPYSRSAAILVILVCAISCILDLVHAGTIISMITMSSQFVASSATNSELYEVIGAAVASARRSAHIVQLVAIGAWMLVFYVSLFRFRLIPRGLTLVGVLGVMLQFTGVTLMMLLGFGVIGEMAMPLLPIEITVAAWLIIKGFNTPRPARVGSDAS